jgi:hypothetical protein
MRTSNRALQAFVEVLEHSRSGAVNGGVPVIIAGTAPAASRISIKRSWTQGAIGQDCVNDLL